MGRRHDRVPPNNSFGLEREWPLSNVFRAAKLDVTNRVWSTQTFGH
jgi:hypothetical protein